eukprot:3204614-Pyramimonas_sp.AAC.1
MNSLRPDARGGKDGASWKEGLDAGVSEEDLLKAASKHLLKMDGQELINTLNEAKTAHKTLMMQIEQFCDIPGDVVQKAIAESKKVAAEMKE